jgi:hypothetical protein
MKVCACVLVELASASIMDIRDILTSGTGVHATLCPKCSVQAYLRLAQALSVDITLSATLTLAWMHACMTPCLLPCLLLLPQVQVLQV